MNLRIISFCLPIALFSIVSCNHKIRIEGSVIDTSSTHVVVVTDSGDTLHIETPGKNTTSTPEAVIGDHIAVTCSPLSNATDSQLHAEQLTVLTPAPSRLICGTWLEPIPGQRGQIQGFRLKEGGDAISINMATLPIQQWSIEGSKLTLKGQSIGNGITIDFEDDYEIQKIDADSLVIVSDNGRTWKLGRAE